MAEGEAVEDMERRARCFQPEEDGKWKLELRRRDYAHDEATWSLPRVPTPGEHPLLDDQGSGEEPKKGGKFGERRRIRRIEKKHTAMASPSRAEIRQQGSKEEKNEERTEEEGEGSEEKKASSSDAHDDGVWNDPLCSPLGEEEDPLLAQEPRSSQLHHHPPSPPHAPASHRRRTTLDQCAEDGAAAWNTRKLVIMQKFAATGIISVSLSFDIMSKDPNKAKGSSIASRLEELDNPLKQAREREETKIISQQEYVTYLRTLKSEIALAWGCDERVMALKAAVKVARLLSDTSVPQFYPTMFVLVTDIMDMVGELVWNRIKARCERDDNSGCILCTLPGKFTSDDVRAEAKLTCLNWFHKIASIRELLPRLYIEMAIARSYYFLESGPPVRLFQRLTSMIRGLADPLSAAYAQLYLARRGLCIMPLEKAHLVQGLDDFLHLFRRVLCREFDEHVSLSGVDFDLYLQLMDPAIQFIVECMLRDGSQEFMQAVVAIFGQGARGSVSLGGGQEVTISDPGKGHPWRPVASVVYRLLNELPTNFLASSARVFAGFIKNAKDLSAAQHMSYRVMGLKLSECPPPRDQRLAVLNDVWRVVSKYSCLPEYLSVADAFIDYVLKNFTQREVDTFLGDVLRHTKNSKIDDGVLAMLESMLFKLLTHYHELIDALYLENFIGILDLFYGELQISMYKRILLSVIKGKKAVADVVAVHFLFDIAKALHDSVDSISGDKERQQIARLITRFVQLVDFQKDREQCLNFLVDCRAVFFNMDYSQQAVAHLVNNLAVRMLSGIAGGGSGGGGGGIRTKRTKDFAKACVSFNEITIMSIQSAIVRLHLFLESSEVALLNGLVGHSETLLKSAVSCLQEEGCCIVGESCSASSDKLAVTREGEGEEQLIGFVCKVAAFLVVAPGHPEFGAFYFLKGLLNVLDDFPCLSHNAPLQGVRTYCAFLQLISSLFQESLPCHVVNVESNDTLYYCEAGYKQEVTVMAHNFVSRLVSIVDQAPSSVLRARRALDFCNTLLICFRLSSQLQLLCSSLIEIAAESLPQTDSYFVQTVEYAAFMGLDHPPDSTKAKGATKQRAA